jgi:hypothetical protein
MGFPTFHSFLHETLGFGTRQISLSLPSDVTLMAVHSRSIECSQDVVATLLDKH